MKQLVLSLIFLGGWLIGCGPVEEAEDPNPGDSTSEEETNTCAYDEAQKGRTMGTHIEDFGLKTYQEEEIYLHDYCSEDNKLVWIVLATGWCGACEGYAKPLEQIYQEYKDKGLRVMWVLGETQVRDQAVSFDWAEAFVDDKDVTYPVFRDYKFYQVYSSIEPHSNSLPHQYLLDANTMELLHAQGGTGSDIENMAFSILDAE